MAIGLAIMGMALHYGVGSFENPGVGFLPFFAGLTVVCFSSVTFLSVCKGKWSPLKDLWKDAIWQRPAVMVGSLFIYTMFLRDAGFVPFSFLLMVLLLRISEPPTWKVTLFSSFMTVIGFYLVFQIWLDAQLPRGFLGF